MSETQSLFRLIWEERDIIHTMFVKKKEPDNSRYLENWPAHYYEIKDITVREKLLQQRIDAYDDPDDKRRLVILQKRYGRAQLRQRPDNFMHALLMIRQMADTNVNALNRSAMNKELITHLETLGVYDEDALMDAEWEDLFDGYLALSRKSFSRPAFLGMGRRDQNTVSAVVMEDLSRMLEEVPSRFHLQEDVASLLAIARKRAEVFLEQN